MVKIRNTPTDSIMTLERVDYLCVMPNGDLKIIERHIRAFNEAVDGLSPDSIKKYQRYAIRHYFKFVNRLRDKGIVVLEPWSTIYGKYPNEKNN